MRDLKPTVLFVDDEELARRTFRKIAEKEFNVLEAESVDQAITVLEQHSDEIGILLSDQRMPGRLGIDLLEYCRKNFPGIVRMLTTAYSELNDAIAAVNRGEIMRYIEKPWGNIDGLLIDLRMAMSLYEVKAENDQLVADKLTAGFKTSQLDKMRSLITVAACQPGERNLDAVETMLRELANIEAYRRTPPVGDMRNYQVFGQPLTDSISAIEIATYFVGQEKTVSTSDNWEVLGGRLATSGIQMEIEGSEEFIPPETLESSLSSAKLAISGSDNSQVKAKVSFNSNGSVVTVSDEGGPTSLLMEWMTGTTSDTGQNKRLAALLATYLDVHNSHGHVRLNIAETGLMNAIELHFYESGKRGNVSNSTQNFDWIDDLMILFS